MISRNTRAAVALLTAGALALSLNSLSSPSSAAPGIQDAAAARLEVQPGGATYRTRPFGSRIAAGKPEYYTLSVPRSGNYRVEMTGLITYDTKPATIQCFVVDLKKILVEDFSGYYLVTTSDSETVFDNGIHEAIDVDLKKRRRILLACSSSVEIEVLKPITVTFQRNGGFKNLRARPYAPPATSPRGLLGNLG